MGRIKHEFFVPPPRQKVKVPPCIKGGQVPCPTCPVRGKCEWGRKWVTEKE